MAPHFEVMSGSGKTLADEAATAKDHQGAVAAIYDWFAAHVGSAAGFAGVGHRVVHGGTEFARPVLLDDAIMRALEALVPLAAPAA